MHSCRVSPGIGTYGGSFGGFATPLDEVAFRLVTVAVVIDVT
jgi:hypothetical protein